MKTNFVMLIGIPGSGKSTWAKTMTKDHVVHSSDAIREELYGSYDVQDNPAKVFDLMQKRTVADLKAGNNVIYDATNLFSKRRMGLLTALKNINCNNFISKTSKRIN